MKCILAYCIASNGLEEYKSMLKASKSLNISVIEIKEIVYLAVVNLEVSRVLPFLIETNKFYSDVLPLVNLNNDNIKGKDIYLELFNEPKYLQDWIYKYVYDDFYTRNGLSLKERELYTYCFLIVLNYKKQLKEHIKANYKLGNDKSLLTKVAKQAVPFIGYLNVIEVLEVLDE